MDATRFDVFARSIIGVSSRRGLVQGITVMIAGWAANSLPANVGAKKRRKKKKRKKASPLLCGPCETYDNGVCTPKAVGAACRTGAICLANGSCAKTCLTNEECGGGCACGGSVDGGGYCIEFPHPISCTQALNCASTADCPRGYQCESVGCPSGPANLCVPLCIA